MMEIFQELFLNYHIPNYNEYYEGRRFTPCFEDNIEIELFGQIVLFGRKVVFACQNLPSFTLGVEICEDLCFQMRQVMNLL